MKELLKKEKVRALINKAKEDKITYEEINEELKDDFPIEKIEKLIHTIIETGGKIVSKSQLEEEDEEEELDEFDEHEEEHKDSDDYIEHEDDILDVITRLRVVYKNIMKLDYDNQRNRSSS